MSTGPVAHDTTPTTPVAHNASATQPAAYGANSTTKAEHGITTGMAAAHDDGSSTPVVNHVDTEDSADHGEASSDRRQDRRTKVGRDGVSEASRDERHNDTTTATPATSAVAPVDHSDRSPALGKPDDLGRDDELAPVSAQQSHNLFERTARSANRFVCCLLAVTISSSLQASDGVKRHLDFSEDEVVLSAEAACHFCQSFYSDEIHK